MRQPEPTLWPALAILIGLFAGCSQEQQQQVVLPSVTYTVSGTVTGSTGTGIAGARVMIGEKIEITDATGYYAIPDLEPGSYSLECSKAGYETFTSEAFEVSSFDRSYTVYLRQYLTIDVECVADSYTRATSPNTNYGASENILVNGLTGGAEGYLRFDFFTLPEEAEVVDAYLWINARVTSDNVVVHFDAVTEEWGEMAITWSNSPNVDSQAITNSLHIYEQGVFRYYEQVMINYVRAVLVGEIPGFGLKVGPVGAGAPGPTIMSRESEHPPYIRIEYLL